MATKTKTEKTETKKLTLRRESLRDLTGAELQWVIGGVIVRRCCGTHGQ